MEVKVPEERNVGSNGIYSVENDKQFTTKVP